MEKIIGQIPAVGAIVVASKVSDRAVTVGEDITKLAIAIHSWVSGEDEMSYLAQKVVYASSISEPRHQKVNESYPPDFLKKASIQEIWEVVSNMRMGTNYDLQAAEAYNTVSLHIYESKSGTNFAKFLRGELHMFKIRSAYRKIDPFTRFRLFFFYETITRKPHHCAFYAKSL